MMISARGLNRATLDRQMLLERKWFGVSEAVGRVVALQAQHPASPYLALWNRLRDFNPSDLDRAFADYSVVKATVMRITLQAVHPDDYQVFREAVDPSLHGARLRDRRFARSGLTPEEGIALIPEFLGFSQQARTADECKIWLDERLGDRSHRGVWWALRQYAPLWRAPTGDPWSFGARTSYVAAERRPALADDEAANRALQTLIKRYLTGFGPASMADVAQFALVTRARVKVALQGLDGEFVELKGPNGERLYDLPGASLPDEETPAPPRLLGMWDNVLLSHADRSRVIPEPYRKHVARSNGDLLPTLLVDGYVAGVWRPVDGQIEASAFHPLSVETWSRLADEARDLVALISEREANVYRRYDRWWKTKLPIAETRLLPED